MESSGSTRSPPNDRAIRLYLLVAREDHPKACTGRKLIHRKLVQEIRKPAGGPSVPILLDPFSKYPLSPLDRGRARRAGVLAVDCSWNRLSQRGRYPGDARHRADDRPTRRLPWLLAANPQHFGRLGELNTAEALAAALVVLGAERQAERVLAGLRGGEAFLELNRERLRAYAMSEDPAGILAAERRLFGGTRADQDGTG
jgi:pre-rRNA-processing protein TSR3